MNRDVGDFQTPPGLVRLVVDRLGPRAWSRVLEPTCGEGRFLADLLQCDPQPRELIGIEIQPDHCRTAQAVVGNRAHIRNANFFELDLATLDWHDSGPLLVVGNPPWVTNAELGALGSRNLPVKSNLKRDRGLDAMTGASNFDIAEAIWLRLINELADQNATIALLCKLSVARRVLEEVHRGGLAVSTAEVVRIDARAWFGVAVEACLLTIRLGSKALECIPVFDRFDAPKPVATMGFVHGKLVGDLAAYAPVAFADGRSPLIWRQGLKHDAAAVMELTHDLRNGHGEPVDVEPEYVFPLLKGADLARAGSIVPNRSVIVTQRRVGEPTDSLEFASPRLWSYLERHAPAFQRRKSSIYRGSPRYAMFGLGPYSFESFKVMVSGLHRRPRFHAMGPVNGRPVMLDDTCYSLACESAEQAALVAALLNMPASVGLLAALTFLGAKRPITKSTLQRIDLMALLTSADRLMIGEEVLIDVQRLLGCSAILPESLETLLEPRGIPILHE